jgi:hypothetical protein
MGAPVAVATSLAAPSGAATVMGVPSAAVAAAAAPAPAPAPPVVGTATVMGVPSAASAVPPPERSPWAPPSSVPPTQAAHQAPPEMPAPAPPVAAASVAPTIVPAAVAAPSAIASPPVAHAVDTVQPASAVVPAAPVLPQAPVVAPPKVSNAPVTKKPADDAKGKFRETMWFKKGDLDAQAAVAAAEERARTGKDVATDKADSLPIDERYKDDGSISRGDKEKYSLRTGATQMMKAVKDKDPAQSLAGSKVSEDALIGEMKGGRSMILLFIGLGVIAIGAIIFLMAR